MPLFLPVELIRVTLAYSNYVAMTVYEALQDAGAKILHYLAKRAPSSFLHATERLVSSENFGTGTEQLPTVRCKMDVCVQAEKGEGGNYSTSLVGCNGTFGPCFERDASARKSWLG